MIDRIESKLKQMISGLPDTEGLDMEIESNPMAGYLKVFQNQHRLIYLLYRGLIIIFIAFLTLNSLFIYKMKDSNILPEWGLAALLVVDVILFVSLYRVISHLSHFKQRSQKALTQVAKFLKKDLSKINRIKNEHANISDTHRALQDRIKMLTGKKLFPKVEDYKGWDKRVCTRCGSHFEMSAETCPYCKQKLTESFIH